jgi:hypothetical protein
MKAFFCVLLLASAIRSCPDEQYCRQCDTNSPAPFPCSLCDHGLQDPITKKCIIAKLSIENCEAYAPSPADGKNHICNKCKLGFFLKDNACGKCPIGNCAECSKEDVCDACFGGKKVAADGKSCTEEAGSIVECAVIRYWTDKEVPECIECNKGFAVVDIPNKCVATKKTNCLKVKDDTKDECATCASGYFLNAKWECAANPSPSGGSRLWVIFLLLIAVGLIAGGAYYFVAQRKTIYRRPNEPLIN